MAKPAIQGTKKPYSSPIITVYGTVRELTQKVFGSKGRDSGHAPRNHTHF